jgi:5-methylcytosine-specific restriction protein A
MGNFMALSKKLKDELEYEALHAFGGRLDHLENGFRIMRDVGQVATVYWSANLPGNDVEIALCDNRLTTSYDLLTVQRWVGREQRLSGLECNVHKHGSDWPIIGFKYDDALAFLARCRLLRRGFLSQEIVEELRIAPANSTADRNESIRLVLSELRPTAKKAVIDLVKAAGVDVSGWYKNKDGTLAKNPRSNPAHCYNWSFGGSGEPMVACLWHGALKIEDGKIVFDDNLRELANRLIEIADMTGEDPEIKNRARTQARRSLALDASLANVRASGEAVRVIVNEGLRRPADMLGKESSKVELRKLDEATWNVVSYDASTGKLRLARDSSGQSQHVTSSSTSNETNNGVRFVDQYTIASADVKREESTGFVYSRSRSVRDAALTRAAGVCELCGKKGFLSRTGTVYLETHHVVPLGEGGSDNEQNVAALCPNDHREAHFGEKAEAIREQLRLMLLDVDATVESAR